MSHDEEWQLLPTAQSRKLLPTAPAIHAVKRAEKEQRLEAGTPESSGRSAGWTRIASVLLRVALFAIALVSIWHVLNGVSLGQMLASMRLYGWRNVALGVAFTTASFLALGLVELFSLRYIGRRAERAIPRRTAITTAFIANAYSQSVGLAVLTGAAVRIRAYSRYGLDALEAARITGFVTATATLGLLTTAAVALLTSPDPFTFLIAGSMSLRAVGALLALIVIAYIGWGVFGKAEFQGRGKWRIRRPSWKVALAQVGISSIDWALAGTVLFVLLPRDQVLPYAGFLGVYFVAQTAAVLSHVPGGVGVFEAIILALLTSSPHGGASSSLATAGLAASLFLYRILYYLLPLCVAIAISGMVEMIRSRASSGPTRPELGGAAPAKLASSDAR